MKKIMVITFVALVLVVSAGTFWYCHPTHHAFNDRYVLGNTKDKIIEKYGAPDRTTENTITYMIRDDTPEMIMGYDNSLWYVIVFENCIANEVYLRKGYPGG